MPSRIVSYLTVWTTFLGALLGASATVQAQIATDGSVGPVVRLSGPEMTVGAELGSTRGANLFHSFQTFDIPTGHSATFTGPDQIRNVIGRVTGGKTSNLDGRLRSTVGQADVFLINPSGIVMGPHATVDVPGALHLSTADELRFSDGARYSAREPAASTLSLAAPESFGFLAPQPASLTVNGSQLRLQPGKTATLTGGDVFIAGDSAAQRATINAPGGAIRMEAVGTAGGRVPIQTPSNQPGRGKLTVEHADLATSGEGGGRIDVQAGEATLNDANLAGDNWGNANALGGIDLLVANALTLSASRIQSNSVAGGASGGLRVRATDLDLRQAGATTLTGLFSEVEPGATGASGGIDVALAGGLRIQGAAGIVGSTLGAGAAGAVNIDANALSIDGEGVTALYRDFQALAGIVSAANPGSSGDAGAVTIFLQGDFAVLNSGAISSATFGTGQAGTVAIRAGGLRLDGPRTWITSSNYANSTHTAGSVTLEVAGLAQLNNGAWIGSDTSTAGHAGQVAIQTGDLEIQNGAVISSSTYAAGNAGTVKIAADTLHIDGAGFSGLTGIGTRAGSGSTGNAGHVTVDVEGLLNLERGAEISSHTYAAGAAGMVAVTAGELRIDNAGSNWITGITSQANSGSTGNAGDLMVRVAGLARLTNNGQIGSDTFSSGYGGRVLVRADVLELLGGGHLSSYTDDAGDAGSIEIHANELRMSDDFSSITSIASQQSSGQSGDVTIMVNDLAQLSNHAWINSSTYAEGDAGQLAIQAGILEISGGARILSDSTAGGDAGMINVATGELRIDGTGSESITGITAKMHTESTGHAEDLTVTVAGLARLTGNALISTDTSGSNSAGQVSVQAETLELLDGGGITSSTSGAGAAGILVVRAKDLRMDNSWIQSLAYPGSSGDAGRVTVTVTETAQLNHNAWISSDTFGSRNANQVTVQAGLLELLNGAQISSGTAATGTGGDVLVRADSLRLIGDPNHDIARYTWIASQAYPGGSGNAGTVTVEVSGLMELLQGATIASETYAAGKGGKVTVRAHDLRIVGLMNEEVTGVTSRTYPSASGAAGDVTVEVAGRLDLLSGGQINSATDREGNAGKVTVTAGELRMNGMGSETWTGITSGTYPGSTGNANTMTVNVAGLLELLGGAQIDSSAYSLGNAGDVRVTAGALRLNGTEQAVSQTAITSHTESSGNAGSVTVNVTGLLELLSGGMIDSASIGEATGNAYTVTVTADDLRIDGAGSDWFTGITSQATTRSTGHVGNIAIQANTLTLLNGGEVDIGAYQTLPENRFTEISVNPRIRIDADKLYLSDGGIIAKSTGNVPASAIVIQADDIRLAANSRINTSAKQAAGGSITIAGGRLWLTDSQITTSVEGSTGNGGDIVLSPDYLILEGGFIQANTAAVGARGGDIRIDTRALLASQGLVAIGGSARQTFVPGDGRNVIQAAAPGGEQGTITVTAPTLDISASLVPLATPFDDPDDLIADLCRAATGARASSLIERGNGGVPAEAGAPAAVPLSGARLDRLLAPRFDAERLDSRLQTPSATPLDDNL